MKRKLVLLRPEPKKGKSAPKSSWRTMIESLDVPVMAISLETGKIIEANSRAHYFWEIDGIEESLLGQDWSQLFKKYESMDERGITSHFIQQVGQYSGLRFLTRSGRNALADISVHHPASWKGMAVLTFLDTGHLQRLMQDINNKKNEMEKMLLELQQQNVELKKLDEAKNKFISLMSHELRTPLSSIVGCVDILINKLYKSDEQARDFMQMTKDEALRLTAIVNDILDLNKIIAGKMDLYVSEINICEVIQKTLARLNTLATSSGVMIETENISKEGVNAFADPDKLLQVFLNVLNNAIKFSRPGARVTVKLDSSQKGWVKVLFIDNGIGIHEKDFVKVFSDFEIIETLESHQKGTGLGMPICKRLMSAMGGNISFTSQLGSGTTFCVSIPRGRVLQSDLYRKRSDGGSSVIF